MKKYTNRFILDFINDAFKSYPPTFCRSDYSKKERLYAIKYLTYCENILVIVEEALEKYDYK